MRILVSGATKTVRQVAKKYPDHLGHLLTPENRNSMNSLHLPYGVDNGAFSGFDPVAFRKLLRRVAKHERRPLWVVCPDVVADARATLGLFSEWQPEIAAVGLPVALVGQDGLERRDVPWDRFACFFVGGSTAWKLGDDAARLAREAKERGKLVHMGRVNTLRRLGYAFRLGCDSIDGKCFSAWANRYLEWGIRFIRRQQEQPVMAFEGQL